MKTRVFTGLIKRLWLCISLTTFTLAGVSATQSVADTGVPELNFLTWSEYIDPAVVAEFEQQFHAKINFTYFEDDDERDAILVKSSGGGFDLAVVNGVQVNAYQRHGWLAHLDNKDIPNLKYIDEKWIKAIERAPGYGVPYFWGTLGIAYRKDLIKEPITRWSQLFHPTEAMREKIIMLGVSRDVVGMALKSLSYSANTMDPKAVDAVNTLLKAQKPYVKSYSYMTLDEKSPLVTGEAVIAMAFSGDALTLKEHNDNIEYVLPEEGGNLWVDYLTVFNTSQRKNLAAQFINFINEPANAARIASFVNYATPNLAAEKRMPKDFLENRVIYPSQAQIDKSEFDAELPPRLIKKRNQIMAEIRHH